jgi:hypothetical protein
LAHTFGLDRASFGALAPRLSLSLATYRLSTLFWAILIALGAIQA